MEQLFMTFFDFFMTIFESVSTFFMPLVDLVVNFGLMAIEGIAWLFTQIGIIIDWFAGIFAPATPEPATALLNAFCGGLII